MASDTPTPVRTTACSSCGAQVPIYSRASIQAVCPYCRSTLVRTDLQWNTVGKMAALADDLSPFYVGMRGQYKASKFTIIGRIQLQYEDGVWNEWLLQLGNRQWWLGEGSGQFYITLQSTADKLPAATNLRLGQQLTLDGKNYSVKNIESASCVAIEGEIPFRATPGESAEFVDLIGEDGQFASLDYSDEVPKLYVGHTCNLDELQLEGIDSKTLKQKNTKELRCVNCGNAVVLRNPGSLLIACASCGTASNVSDNGKLVLAFHQTAVKQKVAIPLGTVGVLRGHEYEVIGFMCRAGGADSWHEYLLYNASQGSRWLINANGHWTFSKVCNAPGYQSSEVFYRSRSFKHFSTYRATVVSVLGEFDWKVKQGELCECTDFISPPYILSKEGTHKEVVWTEGIYLDSTEIASAFNIKEPDKQGVGINQPSPPVLEYISAWIACVFLALLFTTLIHINKTQVISVGSLTLKNQPQEATPHFSERGIRLVNTELTSEPFTLTTSHGLLQVHTSTSVANNWVDFEYRLTNQATGESRLMNREVSYYSGYDSDGSWSEGSDSDDATLANVPAGTYVLEVSAEMEKPENFETNANISISHGQASSKNIWLLILALGLGPALAGINKYYFEKRRWNLSDHPWE